MWWDNRQSMHRASAYDENMGARDVRRSTVFDNGEEALGVPAPAGALVHVEPLVEKMTSSSASLTPVQVKVVT